MNKLYQNDTCECCNRTGKEVARNWDGLYGCCQWCSWCWSLDHFPCCHGTCYEGFKEK